MNVKEKPPLGYHFIFSHFTQRAVSSSEARSRVTLTPPMLWVGGQSVQTKHSYVLEVIQYNSGVLGKDNKVKRSVSKHRAGEKGEESYTKHNFLFDVSTLKSHFYRGFN